MSRVSLGLWVSVWLHLPGMPLPLCPLRAHLEFSEALCYVVARSHPKLLTLVLLTSGVLGLYVGAITWDLCRAED